MVLQGLGWCVIASSFLPPVMIFLNQIKSPHDIAVMGALDSDKGDLVTEDGELLLLRSESSARGA
jgi:hypothetical protein